MFLKSKKKKSRLTAQNNSPSPGALQSGQFYSVSTSLLFYDLLSCVQTKCKRDKRPDRNICMHAHPRMPTRKISTNATSKCDFLYSSLVDGDDALIEHFMSRADRGAGDSRYRASRAELRALMLHMSRAATPVLPALTQALLGAPRWI